MPQAPAHYVVYRSAMSTAAMEVTELDGPHSLMGHEVCESAIAAIADHAFFEQVRIVEDEGMPRQPTPTCVVASAPYGRKHVERAEGPPSFRPISLHGEGGSLSVHP